MLKNLSTRRASSMLLLAALVSPLPAQATRRTHGPPPPSPSHTATARTTAGQLHAGAAARVITPFEYERYDDKNLDATYQPETEPFFDTGVDRRWDAEEPGALGTDGKPGRAGFDDDGNGTVDDPTEYLAVGSDDVPDPAGDNYHPETHPGGTEGNGVFESVALAGYQGFMGEDIRPMNGVHDELWARALALDNGDTQAILIVTDLLGVLFHYLNPVKRDLEAATGVPFENIIIASTHTHAGPDTVGLWAGQVYPTYMQLVKDRMLSAGLDAWSGREPVALRSATATPDACYDQTTLVRLPESECFLGDYEAANVSGDPTYDRFMMQIDMRDPWVRRMEIPVMQLTALSGRTVATLVNFDDHPEVMLDENPLASSDFPHWVRAGLEEAYGGVSIYISGTLGSQMGALRGTPLPLYDEEGSPVYQQGITDAEGNPVPVWASGHLDRTRSLGFAVADFAQRALDASSDTSDPAFRVVSSTIDVSIENPVYRLLMQKIRRDPMFEEDASLVKRPWCSSSGCVRTPIAIMTLGDATFLTAPGEFPPEYSVGREESIAPYSQTDPPYEDYIFPALPSIRSVVETRELFWIGLANSYYGYAIPYADTLALTDTDHPNYYEEGYNPNTCFGDSVGNRLLEMLGSAQRFSECVAHP